MKRTVLLFASTIPISVFFYYARMGIGTKLLEAITEEARAQGLKSLQVTCVYN